MSRHAKKPKYRLDPKKFMEDQNQAKKKDKDWSESDLYNEVLRAKSRFRH